MSNVKTVNLLTFNWKRRTLIWPFEYWNVVRKDQKYIRTSYNGGSPGGWNISSRKTRASFSYPVNTMAADDLAMKGARVSAIMILTQFSLNIKVLEGLRWRFFWPFNGKGKLFHVKPIFSTWLFNFDNTYCFNTILKLECAASNGNRYPPYPQVMATAISQ